LDGRRKVPPTRVFWEKRLQAVENKGNERRKEHKETTKRLQAEIYGDLKIALAKRFREDRPGYMTAKGEFVAELTSRAIATQKQVMH
jgi:hypothetical protein